MKRPIPQRTIALAAVCLAAGIAIGLAIPRGAERPAPVPARSSAPDGGSAEAGGRNMFSPDIANDAYVRGEQRRIVEMLEQQCRSSGKDCQLAQTAREALDRNLAAR